MTPSATPPRADGGFTLVEMLVAISIASIFATALFSFFFAGTETSRGQQDQAQALAEARTALAFLNSDLRQAIGLEEGDTAPLYGISPTAIEFYLDTSRAATALEASPRRVRYAIVNGQLIRESAAVTAAPGAYTGREVLVQRVVNGTTPLFAAQTIRGTALASTMTSASADLIRTGIVAVRLVVGYRRGQLEGTSELRTEIALRNAPPDPVAS